MTHPYFFLDQYIHGPNPIPGTIVTLWNTNRFIRVAKKEIEKAEKILGFPFPSQLRQFYEEIGYGNLTTPHNPPKDYHFYNTNEILPPLIVAHFYKGIIEHHTIREKEEALHYEDDYYFAHELLDYSTPGDLPFFEIGDSSSFLFMKPNSKSPNKIYDIGGDIVEKEFKNFIWKLYYDSPSYYCENW